MATENFIKGDNGCARNSRNIGDQLIPERRDGGAEQQVWSEEDQSLGGASD
jgi:hypothetical protein